MLFPSLLPKALSSKAPLDFYTQIAPSQKPLRFASAEDSFQFNPSPALTLKGLPPGLQATLITGGPGSNEPQRLYAMDEAMAFRERVFAQSDEPVMGSAAFLSEKSNILTRLRQQKQVVYMVRDKTRQGSPLIATVMLRESSVKQHPNVTLNALGRRSGVNNRENLRWAYVYGLAVDPAYQNQGIARALVQDVIERVRKERFDIITVNVMNPVSRTLFEDFGFRQLNPKKIFGYDRLVLPLSFRFGKKHPPLT